MGGMKPSLSVTTPNPPHREKDDRVRPCVEPYVDDKGWWDGRDYHKSSEYPPMACPDPHIRQKLKESMESNAWYARQRIGVIMDPAPHHMAFATSSPMHGYFPSPPPGTDPRFNPQSPPVRFPQPSVAYTPPPPAQNKSWWQQQQEGLRDAPVPNDGDTSKCFICGASVKVKKVRFGSAHERHMCEDCFKSITIE